MPQFRYKAYTSAGTLTEGDIEAASSTAAIEALYRQNLVPFSTSETADGAKDSIWTRDLFGSGGIGRTGLAVLTRELATLTAAKLPLDECLRILASQSRNKKQKAVANKVLARVLDGDPLSTALEAEEDTFPGFYVSMVRAGETAGVLGSTLEDLADYLERQAEIRAKIASALIYPVILLAMAVAALVVIVAFLIPQLAPLFEGTGRDAPTAIAAFQTMRAFIEERWLMMGGASAVGVAALAMALSNEKVRLTLDRLKLHVPVFGDTVAAMEAARFARSLGSLLRGGVSLMPALDIVRAVSRNRVVKSAIASVIEEVREGAALHVPLKSAAIYPDFAVRLVEIGERAGKLDEMLLHAASIFEAQVQRRIDRLMSLLTPVLTLVIGLGVGGLMMSVMNAILSVNDLAF